MEKIFEVSVQYDKRMSNGYIRKTTDVYIIEALSFADAELRAYELISDFIDGDSEVIAEKIINIAEVVTTDDASADKFYKVKHSLITIDEKSAREKKQAQYIIIQASSVDDARDRYKQYIKEWLVDVVMEALIETKYVDYFPL